MKYCDYCQCAACEKSWKCLQKKCGTGCGANGLARRWTPDGKSCRGFVPDPLHFIASVKTDIKGIPEDYHYILIRIAGEPMGLEPYLTPPIGACMLAMEGIKEFFREMKNPEKALEWCIVPYKGRKICLRNTQENGPEYTIIKRLN